MKKIFGLLIIFSIFILTSCEIDFPLLTPDKTKEPTNPTTPTVEINSYDIIFVYNDDNGIINKFTFEEGTEITNPNISEISKVGYEPEYWYLEDEFITKVSFPFNLNQNTKLFLKWVLIEENTPTYTPTPTPINYEINLMDGSTLLSTETVLENTPFTKPNNPTKEGFEFICWSTKPDFKQEYNFNTPVTSNLTLYAIWEEIIINTPTPDPVTYSVTFMDGSAVYLSNSIVEGGKVSKPTNPSKAGFNFICWSTNSSTKQEFNFNTSITSDLVLYAYYEEIIVEGDYQINVTNFGGYNEGAFFEFDASSYSTKDFVITYKKDGSSTMYTLDEELIRSSSNTIRCDILGLPKGSYSVTIKNTTADVEITKIVSVTEHDRSGYAHFDNNGGVGAYNDDGSLKTNTIVIYVNDSNKNTISVKLGSKTYTGLGEILAAANKSSQPICVRILDTIKTAQWNYMYHGEGKTSERQNNLNKVFNNGSNFTKGKLYYNDIVSLGINSMSNDLNSGITILKGLTTSISYSGGEYDSYYNMLDINQGSNITIEGVGTNAGIYQWGINFKKCNNIEVRNLTFDRYTEDALGFEGDSKNISTYGNYWVHNCTFNIGVNNWDVCYEADKGDGDGSTDFKYCRGVTISYCKYNKTHKTILIGGSDSAKQYNFTLHHNYFNNCSSRLPLVRQTNIHLYNNYFYKTTGTCSSIRANCSMFAENNYYESSKNPFNLVKTSTYTGTSLKAFGNYFSNCSTSKNSSDGLTTYLKANNVNSRLEQIKGSCNPTGNKELINFDTNSSLFYYDSVNKVSDVTNMLDASLVKEHCINYSGVIK